MKPAKADKLASAIVTLAQVVELHGKGFQLFSKTLTDLLERVEKLEADAEQPEEQAA